MKNEIASKLYNFFLLVMLFTLPVTEGLKQISLILFVLVGIYICVKEKKQFKFDVINISHSTTKGKNLCAILENFFNFRKQKPQNSSGALNYSLPTQHSWCSCKLSSV